MAAPNAESVDLDKIQQQLSALSLSLRCAICLSIVPKSDSGATSLPCSHFFCTECILQCQQQQQKQSNNSNNNAKKDTITCPTCRQDCSRRQFISDHRITRIVTLYHELKHALEYKLQHEFSHEEMDMSASQINASDWPQFVPQTVDPRLSRDTLQAYLQYSVTGANTTTINAAAVAPAVAPAAVPTASMAAPPQAQEPTQIPAAAPPPPPVAPVSATTSQLNNLPLAKVVAAEPLRSVPPTVASNVSHQSPAKDSSAVADTESSRSSRKRKMTSPTASASAEPSRAKRGARLIGADDDETEATTTAPAVAAAATASDNEESSQSEADKDIDMTIDTSHVIKAKDTAAAAADTELQLHDEACHVCCSIDAEEDEDQLIFCDGCNVSVHAKCYGVVTIPDGDWFCDRCVAVLREKSARASDVVCCLCSNTKDRAFKRAAEPLHTSTWVHISCALWHTGPVFVNPETRSSVDKLWTVEVFRFKLQCSFCNEDGAALQCGFERCAQAYHVTCGFRHKGVKFELKQPGDDPKEIRELDKKNNNRKKKDSKSRDDEVYFHSFCSQHAALSDRVRADNSARTKKERDAKPMRWKQSYKLQISSPKHDDSNDEQATPVSAAAPLKKWGQGAKAPMRGKKSNKKKLRADDRFVCDDNSSDDDDAPLASSSNAHRASGGGIRSATAAGKTKRRNAQHQSTPLGSNNAASSRALTQSAPSRAQHSSSSTTFASHSRRAHIEHLTLLTTSLSPEQIALCHEFAEMCHDQLTTPLRRYVVCVTGEFTDQVTHLLTPASESNGYKLEKRTMKVFQCLLSGAWIVGMQWILDAMATKLIQPELSYQLQGDLKSVGGFERAHAAMWQHGGGGTGAMTTTKRQLIRKRCALLRRCEFALAGQWQRRNLQRDVLELIQRAGGRVLQAPLRNPLTGLALFGKPSALVLTPIESRELQPQSMDDESSSEDERDAAKSKGMPRIARRFLITDSTSDTSQATLSAMLNNDVCLWLAQNRIQCVTSGWFFDTIVSYHLAPLPAINDRIKFDSNADPLMSKHSSSSSKSVKRKSAHAPLPDASSDDDASDFEDDPQSDTAAASRNPLATIDDQIEATRATLRTSHRQKPNKTFTMPPKRKRGTSNAETSPLRHDVDFDDAQMDTENASADRRHARNQNHRSSHNDHATNDKDYALLARQAEVAAQAQLEKAMQSAEKSSDPVQLAQQMRKQVEMQLKRNMKQQQQQQQPQQSALQARLKRKSSGAAAPSAISLDD